MEGTKIYFIDRADVEEAVIQAVKGDIYTVKSGYYTFDLPRTDCYATEDEVLKALQEQKETYLKTFEYALQDEPSFISFCTEMLRIYVEGDTLQEEAVLETIKRYEEKKENTQK